MNVPQLGLPLLIIFFLVGIAIAGGWYLNMHSNDPIIPDQVFCTQDVKMCPDGSYVGRAGPNCEFQECPKQQATINTSQWKTYRNEGFGFEFQYPPEWTLRMPKRKTMQVVVKDQRDSYIDTELHQYPYFGVSQKSARNGYDEPGPANPQMLPLEKWASEYFRFDFFGPLSVSEKENIVVGGQPAIRIRPRERIGEWYIVYIPLRREVLDITYNGAGKPTHEKILSTFKFIEN